MITREIINPNILYDNKFDLDHIYSLINRWKQLFYRQGASKGDLVAISILNVNHWHVSAIFACAELGLRILLLDSPAKKESLPFTKLARFGPARFCLDDGSGRNLYDGLHQEMINSYSQIILTPRDAADWDDDDVQPWTVEPDDPFLFPVQVGQQTSLLWSSSVTERLRRFRNATLGYSDSLQRMLYCIPRTCTMRVPC